MFLKACYDRRCGFTASSNPSDSSNPSNLSDSSASFDFALIMLIETVWYAHQKYVSAVYIVDLFLL